MNQYTAPRPFTGNPFDEERDREHPSPDGNDFLPRLVVERHIHQMRTDATDEWAHVPVTAVMWPSVGEVIELGPWSMSADEARLLAASLTALTNLIDTTHPDALIHDVTEETNR